MKRNAKLVFKCKPNGTMHDVIDDVEVLKIVNQKLKKYENVQGNKIPKIKFIGRPSLPIGNKK